VYLTFLSTITMYTTLIMFAVIAAFGLLIATAAVLPIVPQAAHALGVAHPPPPSCNLPAGGHRTHTPPSPPCPPS
jgi:hypothetical protein